MNPHQPVPHPPRPGRFPRAGRPAQRHQLALLSLILLVATTLALVPSASNPVAEAGPGEYSDSTWMPFVGQRQMWCTKSTGVGACASHHNGWAIDITVERDQPLFATGSGQIAYLDDGCDPNGGDGGCNSRAGNWVAIDHDTHFSRYMHLSAIVDGLEIGDWIEAGDLVGYGGNSGNSASSNDHLHYDETNPYNLPTERIFFGPFLACHGDQVVTYPDVLGTTDWQQVPHGSMLRNDGYECLGGTTIDPPPPTPTPTPTPTDPQPGGSTGLAIGDFRDSGHGDLAIGVPGEALGSTSQAGMVAVAFGDDDGLGGGTDALHQRSSLPGAAEAGDWAGAALATGDFDCDGHDDLAIGTPGEDIGSVTNAGMVTVTYGSSSGVEDRAVNLYQTKFLPGPLEAGDLLGAALATGDFNGDGCDDLAIGSPGEDINTIVDGGAVMAIYGRTGGFSASAQVSPLIYQGEGIAGTAETRDLLGATLTSGDFDCDGHDDLAIGVPREDIGSSADAGFVAVISGSPSGLEDSSTNMNQGDGLAGIMEGGDRVGAALASGDYDGDGCDDLAVGAPGEDLGSSADAGAVSVAFGGASGFTNSTVHYQSAGMVGTIESGDLVGSALATADLNCDGFDDLAVGAPGEAIGSVDDAGWVGFLRGTSSGFSGSLPAVFQGNNGSLPGANETGDAVGSALAGGDIDGDGCDDLAIGSPGEDIGSRTDAGVVLVVLSGAGGHDVLGSFYQSKNLPGSSEAGDLLGGPTYDALVD